MAEWGCSLDYKDSHRKWGRKYKVQSPRMPMPHHKNVKSNNNKNNHYVQHISGRYINQSLTGLSQQPTKVGTFFKICKTGYNSEVQVECLARDHKGISTGAPRFIALRFIAFYIRKKNVWLTLLQDSVYCGGLERNPKYLQGMPEAEPGLEPRPSHPRVCYINHCIILSAPEFGLSSI